VTITDSEIALKLEHGPDNPRNPEGAFVTLADGRILFTFSHCYRKGTGGDEDRARAKCPAWSLYRSGQPENR